MQADDTNVLNLILVCHFAHEMRTLSDTPKDMCTGKSRHMRSRQQYFMVACKRRTVRGLGSEPQVLCALFPCLNIAVSVGTCWRLNDIHCSCMCSSWDMTCGVVFVAIGSYRGRKVVRRAASCALFDRDVCKFETSRDTFRGFTGVMSIAKTRGMRSCICHDLCHVARKHHHWTNKVCVRGKVS